MAKIQKSEAGFSIVEFLIIIIILVFIGLVGWIVYKHNHKSTHNSSTITTVSQPAQTAVTATATDTWIGNGPNNNWSTSTNWSNGVPQSNYALVFDYNNSDINSNNDLSNLTLNKITFEGGPSTSIGSLNINLTGNPVNISDGIIDKTGGGVSSNLAFNLNISAGQNFNIGNGELTLTTVNLENNTLIFNGNNYSTVLLNSLSGSGNLNSGIGSLNIGQSSPQYLGKTTISNGALEVEDRDSLGSGSIVITNGASLILSTGSNAMTINNPITLGGDGYGAGTTQYQGAIGAIETLNTANGSTNVTLSGKVVLTANTKLAFTNDQTNNPGEETYLLTGAFTSNGYTLKRLTKNVTISDQ